MSYAMSDMEADDMYGNYDEDACSDGIFNGSDTEAHVDISPQKGTDSMDYDKVMAREFNCIADAEKFYFGYGAQMGFDARRCHSKLDKEGVVKNFEWECSRAGWKKVSNTPPARKRKSERPRCGCKAGFRVVHDSERKIYTVTKFNTSHNHDLENPETSRILKCKRAIPDDVKARISLFRDVGLRPCQIVDLMEREKLGPGSLPFTKRAVYNFLNKYRLLAIRDGDINTALGLLEGMKLFDQDVVHATTISEDKTLGRLFWADGFSRAAYDKFGDILVLDSTYKTNRYKFPLVILSGIDNHGSNVIFGAALMYNETIESYVWLFKTFMETMGGKAPISVVTDQDDAMRAAIKAVFPQARHRLCGWHLSRNCNKKVKSPGFLNAFAKLSKYVWSIDEFEHEWDKEVKDHGVVENAWVKETYALKELWSEAYFRGHFMGMTRTTQRAESLNSTLKQHGVAGSTITEFLKYYHHVVAKIRANFLRNQEDSESFKPSIKRSTPLYSLRMHASTIYTKSIYDLVVAEIEKEPAYLILEKISVGDRVSRFVLRRYGEQNAKQWTVTIDLNEERYNCDCQKLESDGLPCRHLFVAFKQMDIMTIPSQCVRQRWTTQIGQQLRTKYPVVFTALDPQSQRYMRINDVTTNLCHRGSQSEAATMKSVKIVERALKDIDDGPRVADTKADIAEETNASSQNIRDPAKVPESFPNHVDPNKIRSRGAPKSRQQKCRKCGHLGHKSTTCTAKDGDGGATQT